MNSSSNQRCIFQKKSQSHIYDIHTKEHVIQLTTKPTTVSWIDHSLQAIGNLKCISTNIKTFRLWSPSSTFSVTWVMHPSVAGIWINEDWGGNLADMGQPC